jgi:hypothetical protein
MQFDISRLRRGELIAGGSALLLLAFMFLLKWYGAGSLASVNAWHALTILRWPMLATIAVALALVYFQATRRSPALPVSLSVIVTTLAALLVLLLIYRVLINEPGPDNVVSQKAGAFLGLVSAIGIAYGGYESIRDEGLSSKDARTEVETVALSRPEPGQPTPPS